MEDVTVRFGDIVGHELDTQKLGAAFFSEDGTGVMLRSHLLVEQAAIHTLDVLTQGRWTKLRTQLFGEKINLLEVLGAPPRLLAPVRTLNNQRNDFAHRGVEIITEQHLLDVLRGLRAFVPQFTDDYLVIFRGKREFNAKFHDCTILQKYAVTAAVLAMQVGIIPQLMHRYFEQTARAN